MSMSVEESPDGDSAEAALPQGEGSDQLTTLRPGLVRVLAPNPSVMTGPGTNSYIVGVGDVAVIDPGPNEAQHLATLLAQVSDRLRYVLVTHHHADHAPLARELADRTGASLVAFGYSGLVEPDRSLRDGDVIELGGFEICALYTPGHAIDHLCYVATRTLDEAPPILFSGDHIMSGSSVVIAPPEGDMTAYLASLERLVTPDFGSFEIAPGHGSLIQDGPAKVRAYLAHRLDREQMVRDALRAGKATAAELVPRIYTRLAPALVRAATLSVWAHLRRLGDLGEASAVDRDQVDATWSLR